MTNKHDDYQKSIDAIKQSIDDLIERIITENDGANKHTPLTIEALKTSRLTYQSPQSLPQITVITIAPVNNLTDVKYAEINFYNLAFINVYTAEFETVKLNQEDYHQYVLYDSSIEDYRIPGQILKAKDTKVLEVLKPFSFSSIQSQLKLSNITDIDKHALYGYLIKLGYLKPITLISLD